MPKAKLIFLSLLFLLGSVHSAVTPPKTANFVVTNYASLASTLASKDKAITQLTVTIAVHLFLFRVTIS